jgi:hypothetical protein
MLELAEFLGAGCLGVQDQAVDCRSHAAGSFAEVDLQTAVAVVLSLDATWLMSEMFGELLQIAIRTTGHHQRF